MPVSFFAPFKAAIFLFCSLSTALASPGDASWFTLIWLTHPPETKEVLDEYRAQIAYLASHPKELETLKPDNLVEIQNRICGLGIADKLPAGDWADLKRNETRLAVSILNSMLHRIDWNVDLDGPRLPIDAFLDPSADAQQKQASLTRRDAYFRERNVAIAQGDIRIGLMHVVEKQRLYLGELYSDENDRVTVLKKNGADKEVVYLLTHPYVPADYGLRH
jgi:hypothetical protein